MFGLLKIHFHAVVLFDDLFGVLAALDHREFVDRLGVVRDRPEAVHGDRDGSHAEEAEGHKAEGEDRCGKQELFGHQGHHRSALGDEIRDEHQDKDREPLPKGGEVSCDQAGQDVQRGTALTGGIDDLIAMAGTGAREDLREFGDQCASDGSAADDHGKGQPGSDAGACDGQIAQQEVAGNEGHGDGDAGGDPDQVGQGMFEVELLLSREQRLASRIVDEVRDQRGDDHQDAHSEDPDDQFAAHGWIGGHGQGQKSDQGYTGDAVGLEAVRRGTDTVTCVVARAIGNDTGVFGVVFRQVENDLHEVRADVGDLGEDATADAQRARAEGLADGKANETGA
jgi:hypothetical protein